MLWEYFKGVSSVFEGFLTLVNAADVDNLDPCKNRIYKINLVHPPIEKCFILESSSDMGMSSSYPGRLEQYQYQYNHHPPP